MSTILDVNELEIQIGVIISALFKWFEQSCECVVSPPPCGCFVSDSWVKTGWVNGSSSPVRWSGGQLSHLSWRTSGARWPWTARSPSESRSTLRLASSSLCPLQPHKHTSLFTLYLYCNSLLTGLPLHTIWPLQLTQITAARLVFNLPKLFHLHIPLMHRLHSLPVADCFTSESMFAYPASFTSLSCFG